MRRKPLSNGKGRHSSDRTTNTLVEQPVYPRDGRRPALCRNPG
jgi:hypothetical protein